MRSGALWTVCVVIGAGIQVEGFQRVTGFSPTARPPRPPRREWVYDESVEGLSSTGYIGFLETLHRSTRVRRRRWGEYLDGLQQQQQRGRPRPHRKTRNDSIPARDIQWIASVVGPSDGTHFVRNPEEAVPIPVPSDEPDEDLDPSEFRRAFIRRTQAAQSAAQGGGSVPPSPSGAFRVEDTVDYNFTRIGGYETIKEELRQITDFMRHPEKYAPYRVRLPRGVLLYGEPGTGKTLLAKCLAGECQLAFIPASGSEFQEKYVGVGPARIRELFQYARENRPCIVFLDEIDGVARRRTGESDNGQAERDTTLNQLLVELDGFRENTGVMMLACTNREDILDPAILRPGRIDKQVHVNVPNYEARLDIARIHLDGKPIEVGEDAIAQMTSGWTGAQIENLLNEVSLFGIRTDTLPINRTVLEKFKDLHGIEKATTALNLSMPSLWRIAVHEMGHVLLALHADHHEKPLKCSIASPNGRMAGYTVFGRPARQPVNQSVGSRPPSSAEGAGGGEDDGVLVTKDYVADRLRILLGGRVAEEILFGTSVSSGARHDLESCLNLARRMVIEFGMGRQIVYSPLSDASKRAIDEDITQRIERAHHEAQSILQKNRQLLEYMARHLLEHRTLDAQQIHAAILEFHKTTTAPVQT